MDVARELWSAVFSMARLHRVVMSLALLGSVAFSSACVAEPPSPLEGLKEFVIDRIAADVEDFRDCSQVPIDYLDAHAVEQQAQWLAHWHFAWARVAIDGGACIYLEKPERRGLSPEEARVLVLAASGQLEFPAPSAVEWVCPKPDIREHDFEWIEVNGRQNEFSYGFGYVEAEGDLARFNGIQRQFASSQKKRMAARPASTDINPSLGISFDLVRSEKMASLKADVVILDPSTHAQVQDSRTEWLMHIPDGKILSLNDLFVHPENVASLIATKARIHLRDRYWAGVDARFEHERQAERETIGRRIDELTDPAQVANWQVTLDSVDACQPGLVVRFEGAYFSSSKMEMPEVRLSASGIRDWLKPKYRDAFGPPTERIAKQPAFTPDVVAGSLPALVELSSHELLPLADLQPDLVDCEDEDVDSSQSGPGVERSHWVYNAYYSWTYRARAGGTCVLLQYPERRGLSRREAWALLSAVKRKLPVEKSRIDPAFAYQYSIEAGQRFGGLPTYEQGTSNGVGYAIGYMGIEASLAPLEKVQRRFAQDTVATTAAQAARARLAVPTGSAPTVVLDFIPGGRTAELAVLVANGSRSLADGTIERIDGSWMLHVPSGKVIRFDDLFVNPAAVRRRISEEYRRTIPSRMSNQVFLDDVTGVQAAAFRQQYERAARLASEPAPDRFRDVRFHWGSSRPWLAVHFSHEELASRMDPAMGSASLKSLRRYLKPKYAHAFDPVAGVPD